MASNISLECIVMGDTEGVDLAWYRVTETDEGEEQEEELVTEEDGVLEIEGVILGDEGEYRCRATRGQQSSEDSTRLAVYRKYLSGILQKNQLVLKGYMV